MRSHPCVQSRLQERAEAERRWNASVFGHPPSLLRLLVLAHALESDSLVADCHSQLLPVFGAMLSDSGWHAPRVRQTSVVQILSQLRAELLKSVQSHIASDRAMRRCIQTDNGSQSSSMLRTHLLKRSSGQPTRPFKAVNMCFPRAMRVLSAMVGFDALH